MYVARSTPPTDAADDSLSTRADITLVIPRSAGPGIKKSDLDFRRDEHAPPHASFPRRREPRTSEERSRLRRDDDAPPHASFPRRRESRFRRKISTRLDEDAPPHTRHSREGGNPGCRRKFSTASGSRLDTNFPRVIPMDRNLSSGLILKATCSSARRSVCRPLRSGSSSSL